MIKKRDIGLLLLAGQYCDGSLRIGDRVVTYRCPFLRVVADGAYTECELCVQGDRTLHSQEDRYDDNMHWRRHRKCPWDRNGVAWRHGPAMDESEGSSEDAERGILL